MPTAHLLPSAGGAADVVPVAGGVELSEADWLVSPATSLVVEGSATEGSVDEGAAVTAGSSTFAQVLTTISTRLFSARPGGLSLPSGFVFGATGFFSP
jgi:hypothetical protein